MKPLTPQTPLIIYRAYQYQSEAKQAYTELNALGDSVTFTDRNRWSSDIRIETTIQKAFLLHRKSIDSVGMWLTSGYNGFVRQEIPMIRNQLQTIYNQLTNQ